MIKIFNNKHIFNNILIYILAINFLFAFNEKQAKIRFRRRYVFNGFIHVYELRAVTTAESIAIG